MADRQTISKSLVSSDIFLNLPYSAQNLYFHLCIRANESGYINNARAVMRATRCKEQDLETLIEQEYIEKCSDYNYKIYHWSEHNLTVEEV